MSAFRGSAERMANGFHANNTIVVEGPPGCGKSALLDQICADLNTYPPDEQRREWLPVFINGSSATSPSAIAKAVDNAIATKLARRGALAQLENLIGEDGAKIARDLAGSIKNANERGFSVAGIRLGAAIDPTIDTIEDAVDTRRKAWEGWNIVLLVDEAQQIEKPADPTRKGTLSSVHQGKLGIPIMFAAFGLVGTANALGDVGVSRSSVSNEFSLGGVSEKHALMACERAMRQFRPKNPQSLAQAVVRRSCGWPQHIASYLSALAESLEEQDIEAILENGDRKRAAYYERRMSRIRSQGPRFHQYARHLAKMLRGADQPMLDGDIIDSLQAEFGMSDEAASKLLTAAEHGGLTRFVGNEGYVAAIPSFLTHLVGPERSQERKLPGIER